MSLRDIIIDLFKIVAALAIIVGVCHYWLAGGPPPRGRGR